MTNITRFLNKLLRLRYPAKSNEELIKQFEKTLRTWKWVSKEHRDYILCKEVYHCSPAELDEVDENILDLHFAFLMTEREHDYIEQQRAKQKAKVKNLKN